MGDEEMNDIYETDYGSDYLMHHGVKGQKWGIRRYQNADGSLTKAGENRYLTKDSGLKKLTKATSKAADTAAIGGRKHYRAVSKQMNLADQYRAENDYQAAKQYRKAVKMSKKLAKAESAGKSSKANKYRVKMQQHAIAGIEFQKRAKTGKMVTDMILSNASAMHYDIKQSTTMRSVNRGKNAVLAMASGGQILSMTLVQGTKYKVREKK